MPNFVLRRTKNDYWEIRWTQGGKSRFKSTRTQDRAAAEGMLARHIQEHHRPQVPHDPKISDLIAAYRDDHLPTIVAKASQGYALDNITKQLGAFRPDEITDSELRNYATWRKAQQRWGREGSGPIGDGTVAREVNALRAVLSWATRNKHMALVVKVRLPVALPPGRERHLSRGEVQSLLHAARGVPHLALFIRIALATAARKSAILELRWNQIVWPEGENPIRWKGTKEYEYPTLDEGLRIDLGRGVGNKRRSVVPIGDNAPLYLGLRKAQKASKSGYVIEFHGKRVADIKTSLATACEKAEIEPCGAHVLKHTSISWMVLRGLPFSVISKLTNTSTAVLEKHYSHLSPELAEKLGDMFSV
jgi:integrase